MRTNHFAVTLGLALAAAGCVETDTDLSTVTQAVCTGTTSASEPMIGASQWTGQLPGDVAGAAAQQVWLLEANNSPNFPAGSFTLYQVDTVKKRVKWRSTLTAAQRTTAAGLAAARNGITVFGRLPPPPPFPPIDLWKWADTIVDDAIVGRAVLEE
jgi:hypothetical protein